MNRQTVHSHPGADRLAESHLGFARALARRLAGTLPRHVDPEALESDAVLGLLLAARSFDPARGVAFTTYAAWRIRGAMLDGLRDRRGIGRDWTFPVIRSLSTPVRDANGREMTIGDFLETGEQAVGDDLERRDQVDHLLKSLRDDERRLVREFYFEGLTQKRISRRRGVSASRISQALKSARQRMAEAACAN